MKILMLTTVYPRPDSPKNTSATRVIQHFTESWQQMGHEVVVIHTVNKLFPLIYFLPESVKRLIKSRTTYEVSDYSIVCEKAYKINGISVFRKPLFKWIPRGLTSARTIRRCARSIADDLQKVGFVPDVILGHWASPSAQLLSELKSYFPAPNALVFHSIHYARMYPQVLKACIRRIDWIGCRSEAHLKEELGDVLMQVLFHTDIEREAGHFDIDDVADAACKKLVYRHPHVFRRDEPDAPDWDTIKQRERAQTTTAEAMDCVARSLPALWRCEKIQAKAAKTGFEWPDMAAALDKVAEETQELREAAVSGDAEAVTEELGDLLFAAVKVARFAGVDPEQAAHAACEKFIRRFAAMEAAAADSGVPLKQRTLAQMQPLWQQAKQTVSADNEGKKSARQ